MGRGSISPSEKFGIVVGSFFFKILRFRILLCGGKVWLIIMKAVRKVEHGPGHIKCVEIDEPKIKPGFVKIKIAYCGICGTDAHIIGGYEPPYAPLPVPFTMGHEFSGTVVEVGEGVTRIAVGDRVTSNVPTGFCGKCLDCLSGNMDLCQHGKNIGYETDGAMTEYFLMEEAQIFKLPDNVSLEEGALVEPACVAAQAVLEFADVKPTDTCVIMGAGPIGLIAMQFVKACGATAISIDLSAAANRLRLAKDLGADYVFENDKCDVVKEILTLTNGRGVDYVFELTGADACISQAILVTRRRGTIVEIGVPNPAGANIQAFMLAVMQSLRIQCSFGYTPATWAKVLKMMGEKRIRTAEMVSHKFSYDECDQAITCNDPGKMKILLHP